MEYLKDEDGNPITYRDGTPVPDIDAGRGINHDDPTKTAFVKATGPDGEDFGQSNKFVSDEYANAYIDQQKRFFPDSGTTFVIRHPYRPAGSAVAVL